MKTSMALFITIIYLSTSWAKPGLSILDGNDNLTSTPSARSEENPRIELPFQGGVKFHEGGPPTSRRNEILDRFVTLSSQPNIKYASNCNTTYFVDDDDEVILTSRLDDSWYTCGQMFYPLSDNKELTIACPSSKFNYGHCWFESLTLITEDVSHQYCHSNENITYLSGPLIIIYYTRRTWYNYGGYTCIIHVSKYNRPNPPPVSDPHCTDAARISTDERIVGGEDAQRKEFPWMAYLNITQTGYGSISCGGVLIAADLVLTAAHCVHGSLESISVGLGKWNVDNLSEIGSRYISVQYYKMHNYFSFETLHNDIALLFLSKKVTFSDYIKPACLPASENYNVDGHVATAAGWGNTDYDGKASNILQKTDLDIYSNYKCHNYWDYFGTTILSSQLCTLGIEKSTCYGDSGGPLFLKDNNNYVIVGLTSFGPTKCVEPYFPNVYTRVSKYLDWIHTTKDKLRTASLSSINDNNIKATEL